MNPEPRVASPLANPYAPPRAAVRDIADPLAKAELADRLTRLGATILDGIVFGVMVYAPMLVVMLSMPTDETGAPATTGGANLALMIGVVLALIGLVVWAVLTLRYVKQNGQTIGKKIVDIKVVRSDGSPASLGRIFWKRNVLNALLSIIPLYGIIDILFIFGEERRCLHDKLADTIVVKA